MLRIAYQRLRSLLSFNKQTDELEEELRFHLDCSIAEKIEAGMSPKAARAAALREFGHVDSIREDCQESWGVRLFHNLFGDFRYGLRRYFGDQKHSILVTLILAFGIGATTTAYTLFESVVLKPLPYPDSEQIAFLWLENQERGYPQFSVSEPTFIDIRETLESTESLVALHSNSTTLRPDGAGQLAENVNILNLTPGLLNLLRLEPLAGRGLSEEDAQIGAPARALISESLWQSRFNRSNSAIGTNLDLDGQLTEIIGVVPDSVSRLSPVEFDIFRPLSLRYEQRGNHYLSALARLKPDVTIEQASAELASAMAGIVSSNPGYEGWSGYFMDAREYTAGPISDWATLLLAAVVLLLLIACANIANLLLAQSLSRRKEFATRLALGCTRTRMLQQLVSENLVLCLLSGILGVLLTVIGVSAAREFLPEQMTRSFTIEIGPSALIVVTSIGLTCASFFSIFPLRVALGTDVGQAMQSESRGATSNRHRLLNTLLYVELSLSVLLLVGTVKLYSSFAQIRSVPLGFETENVLTLQTSLSWNLYPNLEQRGAYYRQLIEQVQAIPGIESAGWSSSLPFDGSNTVNSIYTTGDSDLPPDQEISIRWRIADQSYFTASGIGVLAGDGFSKVAKPSDPREIIISDSLASRVWPDSSPIGKTLRTWLGIHRVVGVVNDLKWDWNPEGSTQFGNTAIYLPLNQFPWWNPMTLVVKHTAAPSNFLPQLRETLSSSQPNQAYFGERSYREIMSESQETSTLATQILAAIATTALILSLAGVYGVVSFQVAQRTKEIGIRLSLGAKPAHIWKQFLRRTTTIATAGAATGWLGTVGLQALFESLTRADASPGAATQILIICLVMLTAALASLLPARRATQSSPVDSIRLG